MRNIKYIVVHCSAGSQRSSAQDVITYHTKTLGWKVCGYHYIIEPDGNVVNSVNEAYNSNGVKGRNSECINVCYIGGVDTSKSGLPPIDNRTEAQKRSLRTLLADIHRRYPAAQILGHRDFPEVRKACPCFDAREEYSDL